ncbi:MAG: efflux RND transporter periplasmic adaptor subunit [Hyphomicrobium sp.]
MLRSERIVRTSDKPAEPAKPAPAPAVSAKVVSSARAPQGVDGQSALVALLKVEAAAREAASERDLLFLIANETRKLTRARQVFVTRKALSGGEHVKAVSSLPSVDRSAPLVQMIEEVIADADAVGGLAVTSRLDLASAAESPGASSYPFRALVWLPLQHLDQPRLGGIVLAREDAWSDSDLIVAKRLAGAYAHALAALSGSRRAARFDALKIKKSSAAIVAAVAAALLLIPVPLSALAPVEIIPRDPFVVAAPIDGVIEEIRVAPNQPVKSGDVIVKMTDTTLRNRVLVAEREVQVADAKLKQANQVAFSDARGLHEIAIARSELSLKLAERDFARDLLDKTEIRAARSGLALYSDKRELIGRPVSVGERILEVADADAVEARVELPVSDAIALAPGGRVKLFLDSDPLRPWAATVKRADYKAHAGENDVMSFRVIATLATDAEARPAPRLGVRGTAQISGDDVPLGLYLFRRPLTAMRQWLGL